MFLIPAETYSIICFGCLTGRDLCYKPLLIFPVLIDFIGHRMVGGGWLPRVEYSENPLLKGILFQKKWNFSWLAASNTIQFSNLCFHLYESFQIKRVFIKSPPPMTDCGTWLRVTGSEALFVMKRNFTRGPFISVSLNRWVFFHRSLVPRWQEISMTRESFASTCSGFIQTTGHAKALEATQLSAIDYCLNRMR